MTRMTRMTRAQLMDTLQRALASMDTVDAAWEGGSAAYGSEDGLSDIDAVAVVADEAIASTFEAVEAALAALSPVVLRYDKPGTVGFSQEFYRLRDAGEFLVVDLVFIRHSDPLLFREVELHGQGLTWFDRRGVLTEAHLDPVRDDEQARARVSVLAAAFAMFQHIVSKEIRRGRAVDALVFYQSMTWRPSTVRRRPGLPSAWPGWSSTGRAAACRTLEGLARRPWASRLRSGRFWLRHAAGAPPLRPRFRTHAAPRRALPAPGPAWRAGSCWCCNG